MGAWIETAYQFYTRLAWMSLPMWERGLKLACACALIENSKSLPMWERGLKQMGIDLDCANISRSPCGSVD